MAETFNLMWQNIFLRIIVVVCVAIGIVLLLQETRAAWGAFLGAFVIAYLFDPVITRLTKSRFIPRGLAVLLVMVFIFSFLFLGAALVANILVFEVNTVHDHFGESWGHFKQWVDTSAPPWFADAFHQVTNLISQNVSVEKLQQEFLAGDSLSKNSDSILKGAGTFLAEIAHILEIVAQTFILLILTAFTLGSFPVIKKSFFGLFPERHKPFAEELMGKVDVSVGGYLRAKILEAFIMGVVIWLTLLVLRVPEAAQLGFLAMALNPIPYLGPFLTTIIITFTALVALGWQKALIVFIIMQIIEQLDGNLLGPMLLSKGVDVHPVAVLVSLLAGGALFGIWGLLLAVPATALLQSFYVDYYQGSKWFKKSAEEAALDQ